MSTETGNLENQSSFGSSREATSTATTSTTKSALFEQINKH